MNYLIIIPRIINKPEDYYQFPQGIAYISSVMSEAGFNLYKLNLNHVSLPIHAALEEAIISNNIDVLLTGGLTGQYGAIHTVLKCAKMTRKNIVTIVGGGIISSAPIYAMQALKYVDYGIIGEGEIIVCDLCNSLESSGEIVDIPGIVYKDEANYKITKGKPSPVDLDSLPFPDYDGLGMNELLKTVPNMVGMSEFNTFPLITSRGCPYRCTFCFHPSGQKFRYRSLDNVFAEIDWIIQKYDIKFLTIQDELFSKNTARLVQFCKRIKSYNINWSASFRVTDVTRENVELLKDSNCVTMSFGIESADDSILKSMNKKITIRDTEKALKIVYDSGVGIQGCLIFGDIAETKETAQKTLNWWKNNSHYGLQLSVIVTYPGTRLFQYACENNLIEDPVQFIRDSCPVVKLSKMTSEDYSWVLEQILSLQRSKSSLPEKIVSMNVDYENSCMDLVALCNSCKKNNTWSKIRFFIAESLTCKYCGRRHYAPIPDEIVDRIQKNIEILLNKYGKICFWGINPFFYALCEMLHLSSVDNIVCVDKSVIRHGIGILGGKVQSTQIISDAGIKCIVVTVPQYYSSIKPAIEMEFPRLDKLLNISELLLEDFISDESYNLIEDFENPMNLCGCLYDTYK